MARTLAFETVALYRTVVTKHAADGRMNREVFGPYDSKPANRDYSYYWYRPGDTETHIQKQELKPVFHLTPDKGLVLGLEWVTYKDIRR